MKIAILGNEGSWYVTDLMNAAHAAGHVASRVDFCSLIGSINRTIPIELTSEISSGEGSLTEFDAVIVRTMPPGSLEQVIFRMDALQRLEAGGTFVVNSPRAIECAVDKFLTTSRLHAAGLPVPRTVVCEDAEQAVSAFEELGSDIVVKPLFGSEGRGISRVTDIDVAYRVFRTLQRTQSVLYLQEFIRHAGFDVRVMTLGQRVLGGMKRESGIDFRTNVARSAIPLPHACTDREAEFALRAAQATGAVFAGVDLLYDLHGECYVIEVNGVPGWRAFQQVTHMQVARQLIDWIAKEIDEHRHSANH